MKNWMLPVTKNHSTTLPDACRSIHSARENFPNRCPRHVPRFATKDRKFEGVGGVSCLVIFLLCKTLLVYTFDNNYKTERVWTAFRKWFSPSHFPGIHWLSASSVPFSLKFVMLLSIEAVLRHGERVTSQKSRKSSYHSSPFISAP